MKANGWRSIIIGMLICLILMGVSAGAAWATAYYYFAHATAGWIDEHCGPVVLEKTCIEMTNPLTGDKLTQCTIEQKGKSVDVLGSI